MKNEIDTIKLELNELKESFEVSSSSLFCRQPTSNGATIKHEK